VYIVPVASQSRHSLSLHRVEVTVPPASALHVHFAQYCWPDCVPVCCTHEERLSSIFLTTCVVVVVMGALPPAHEVPALYVYVSRLPDHGWPQACELSQSLHAQSTVMLHVEVASLQPVSSPPGV